jgi:hypothetical protein
MRVLILCAFLLTSVAQAQGVEQSTTAVSYCGLYGAVKLGFVGTLNLPGAHGRAEIEREKGPIEIKAKIEHMAPASVFGAEYLTYVLWAIPPDNPPINLGEIVLDGNNHGKLEVMTRLQAFALIVTAEPYFAVTQPSNVVVLENSAPLILRNPVNTLTVKYEVLPAGYYIANLRPVDLKGLGLMNFNPLEVKQAENAIRIAEWAHASKYAPNALAAAECCSPPEAAVETAADARLLAIMRQGQPGETCAAGAGRKP